MESCQIIDFADRIDKTNLQRKKIDISEKDILTIRLDYFFNGQKDPFQDLMNHIEKDILIQALLKFKGNQRKAAEYLGLKANTLNFKIKKHRIGFLKITA